MKWFDLGDRQGARLKAVKKEGSTYLVLTGLAQSRAEWQRCVNELGFSPVPSGKMLIRLWERERKSTLADWKPIFPATTVREMDTAEIMLPLAQPKVASDSSSRANHTSVSPQTRTSARESSSIDREDGAARYWGRNSAGDKVFEGAFGRFLIQEVDGARVDEVAGQIDPRFLRAGDDSALAICADGFVAAMRIGEVQYQQDVERFATAVAGASDETAVLRARTAIDGAIARSLRTSFDVPYDAYDTAVSLYLRLPENRVLQRGGGAVPLPLAVAAQWLIGDTAGRNLWVPNAFDGSFASVIDPTSRVFAGVNERAIAEAHRLSHPSIDWRSASSGEQIDALIFNADPVRGVSRERDGVSLAREDLVDALNALGELRVGGRAVLVLAVVPGDEPDEAAFYGHLARRFTVDGAFEASPEMQRRVGTGCALRVVTLRNDRPTVGQRIEFPVLHDWEPLRDLVREIIRSKGIREAGSDEVDIDQSTEENVLQVPYQAASRYGEARTMVPKNMASGLAERFAEIESLYGPVDTLVAEYVGLSPAEIGDGRLSPEQIDACALGMTRIVRTGRGFILGDETGIGKGRTVSTFAHWGHRIGKKVIFITDTSNLFSDLMRDMTDIQAWDQFTPMMMNADAVLLRLDGHEQSEVLGRGTPVAEMRRIMAESKTMDDLGVDLLFSTYSQFNAKGSPKAKWVLEQCQDALVILDEAHEAAGAGSNIANFVEELTQNAWGVLYSTATWAKNQENMGVYARALPGQVNPSTLRDTMRRGGEGFMEVFSSMLAREGAMIRREHDLSRLEFRVEVDLEHIAQHEVVSDQVAEVLGALAYVAGETNRLFHRVNGSTMRELEAARSARVGIVSNLVASGARELVRQGQATDVDEQLRAIDQQIKRMKVARLVFNLGTSLYQAIRRVEAALTAEFGAQLAIRALQEGRKPVIVFEDTGEALVKKLIDDERARLLAMASAEGDSDVPARIKVIPRPTLKDMLRKMTTSLGVVSWDSADKPRSANGVDASAGDGSGDAGNGGNGRLQLLEEMENLPHGFLDNYRAGMRRIMEAIDVLPDIPIVAADIVHERLAEAGYKTGEISGRTSMLRRLDDKHVEVVPRNASKRVVTETVNAFNSGEIDAAVINNAAAVGISMHASPRFIDTRQRELIEVQIPANVNNRIQLFGRVNRYDQLSSPLMTSASSGLYASMRQLMMQNNKLRRLSANVRSSRNNTFEDKRIPDLLNSVGNEAARQFLLDNPGIMVRMGLESTLLLESSAADVDFADLVMKRVPLLKVNEQRRVYEELMSRFDDIVLGAELRGESPLRQREIAHVVKQGDRQILTGHEVPGQSIFDAPVYASEITWDEEITPLSWTQAMERVGAGRERLVESAAAQSLNDYVHDIAGRPIAIDSLVTRVCTQFQAMARIGLAATNFASVEAALADPNLNPVRRAAARADWFGEFAPKLLPGSVFSIPSEDALDDRSTYLVTGWTLQASGREMNFGQYRLQVLDAGATAATELSLNFLFDRGDEMVVETADAASPVAQSIAVEMLRTRFANAPSGVISHRRKILDGNLYAASELAAANSLGTGVLFTDESGLKRRGILLNRLYEEVDLSRLPRPIGDKDVLRRFIHELDLPGNTQGGMQLMLYTSLSEVIRKKGSPITFGRDREGKVFWIWTLPKQDAKKALGRLKAFGSQEVLGQIGKKTQREITHLIGFERGALLDLMRAANAECLYISREFGASINFIAAHQLIDSLEEQVIQSRAIVVTQSEQEGEMAIQIRADAPRVAA